MDDAETSKRHSWLGPMRVTCNLYIDYERMEHEKTLEYKLRSY
jgi:hypothetical protein